jgi:hypothetical protein
MGAIDRLLDSRAATAFSLAADAAAADDRERSPGRSLIPLSPQPRLPCSPRLVGPSSATFLAQLIAIKQRLPQTRERRRADPEDASAAYDATGQDAGGTMPGRKVTRIV